MLGDCLAIIHHNEVVIETKSTLLRCQARLRKLQPYRCSLLFTDGYMVLINKNMLLVLQLPLKAGNNGAAMLFHLISDCKNDVEEAIKFPKVKVFIPKLLNEMHAVDSSLAQTRLSEILNYRKPVCPPFNSCSVQLLSTLVQNTVAFQDPLLESQRWLSLMQMLLITSATEKTAFFFKICLSFT